MKRPIGLALLCVMAFILTACSEGPAEGSSNPETYDDNGVTFRYPGAWSQFEEGTQKASTGNEVWSTTVGLDEVNIATMTEYHLTIEIDEDNLSELKPQIDATMQQLLAQAGGELQGSAEEAEMGGLAGYEYAFTGIEVEGATVDSRVTLVFDGAAEYFLNCQYTTANKNEMLEGCDQIVASFEAG